MLTARRDRVVPGIPGAKTAGVTILGDAALTARWLLGTGETLAIAISFSGSGTALPGATGELLAESEPGVWEAARGGTLRDRASVAWIEPAGGSRE